MKKRFFIYFLIILILVFLVTVIFLPSWGKNEQPLAFNHKIHMENDMDCEDCHLYFKNYAFSGRPKLDICLTCHEEPLGNSQAEKTLIEYLKKNQEIEWKRIYRLPEDVYFSHRRHVSIGKIDCSICHGDIGQRSRPPHRPLKKISMKMCMKCHQKMKVNNDCLACHR